LSGRLDHDGVLKKLEVVKHFQAGEDAFNTVKLSYPESLGPLGVCSAPFPGNERPAGFQKSFEQRV
jgi:hypothetical protein